MNTSHSETGHSRDLLTWLYQHVTMLLRFKFHKAKDSPHDSWARLHALYMEGKKWLEYQFAAPRTAEACDRARSKGVRAAWLNAVADVNGAWLRAAMDVFVVLLIVLGGIYKPRDLLSSVWFSVSTYCL